jgi:sodium/hydrogen antiporter
MAGLTISALDVELCDCFLEYGETTAEMALLFTFVLLGSSLIWSGFALLSVFTVLFALGTILVRPFTFLISLIPSNLDKKSRVLISWFGPRGLSSLLLVLLPVFAGVPGSDRIFSYCCLVVICSVAVHGGSLMALSRWKDRTQAEQQSSPVPEAADPPVTVVPETVAPLPEPSISSCSCDSVGEVPPSSKANEESKDGVAPIDRERITLAEMQSLIAANEPVVILDVRKERTLEQSDSTAKGAIRIHPDFAVREAKERGLPRDSWLIAFCT